MAHLSSSRKLTLVVSLTGMLAIGACSHRTAYVRDGLEVPGVAASTNDAISARVVLVGDAGETSTEVLSDVSSWASRDPEKTIVIFLGDNFYPEGMTPERAHEANSKLLPQLEATAQSGARVLFVPGNHDWDDGGSDGYDAILAQADYIESHLGNADGFLPVNGCPGPAAIDSLPAVRIIAVDTQWWLHEYHKPVEACPHSNAGQFRAALSDLVDTDRTVVIAAHHPLFGFGRHAGFSEWREHLLPPIVGTAIALTRKFAPGSQDYNSEPYQAMTALFRSAIPAPNQRDNIVIWAAGHEHNLQVLEGRAADYVVISGSAAKTTPVGDGPETLFAHSHPGFMVLDFMGSNQVQLQVVEPDSGEVFARWFGTQD